MLKKEYDKKSMIASTFLKNSIIVDSDLDSSLILDRLKFVRSARIHTVLRVNLIDSKYQHFHIPHIRETMLST